MRERSEILADAEALFAFLSEAEAPEGPADIVLALGSQDLGVAAAAARAFREVPAALVVCTGGLGKDTAALFHEPEGILYARECRRLGVPEDRLLVEDRATNSGENFRFSRALLESRGLRPRTGVIACKPYMARRAWAAGTWQWPEVRWSVFPQGIGFQDYLRRGNDRTAVLELMVGDLQRLRVYSGRFQTPVTVPPALWSACERLAADGYDRFVLREDPSVFF